MQTISQMRSKYALDLLAEIGKEEGFGEIKGDFVTFTKSVPAMILQNGLGQAMAFIKAKAKDDKKGEKYDLLYETVNHWLKSTQHIQNDILKEIPEMSARKYIGIQNETLRFLEWLKRYAIADIFK